MAELKNPFRLRGTARRRELFLAVLVFAAALAATAWLGNSDAWWRQARFGAALSMVALMAVLATVVRRLHDTGRSGAWSLLLAVPFVGVGLIAALLVWPPASRKRNESGLGTLMGVVVLCVLGLVAFLRLFLQPYFIPSEAMKPTLLVGDVALVRLIGPDSVTRGDLVAFHSPDSGSVLVFRAIGLPGDTVQMQDGKLWLNGAEVPQDAAGSFTEVMGPQGPLHQRPRCESGAVGDGGQCRKARFTETLPDGRKYDVLNIQNDAYADNTDVFTVPEGSFFVLGDNRDNSMDSRYARGVGGPGLVANEDLIGRLGRVALSTVGDRIWQIWNWRGDRWLVGVE